MSEFWGPAPPPHQRQWSFCAHFSKTTVGRTVKGGVSRGRLPSVRLFEDAYGH